MSASDLVVVQGLRRTRATVARWNEQPGRVVGVWAACALVIAVGLLGATWAVAVLATPDAHPFLMPGLQVPPSLHGVGTILFRNSWVLALHAFACVAGFIAGSSLPLEAERYSGTWRWIHDRAGPLAIGFVGAAILFSLTTQAYILGNNASTLASQLDISSGLLLLCLLPHAIPELVALFLPLAAWLVASRRGRWDEL
ncbi:MAG TPA: hypothetical protein VGI54_00080, partial [Solirubrobacteraceae bacterium]